MKVLFQSYYDFGRMYGGGPSVVYNLAEQLQGGGFQSLTNEENFTPLPASPGTLFPGGSPSGLNISAGDSGGAGGYNYPGDAGGSSSVSGGSKGGVPYTLHVNISGAGNGGLYNSPVVGGELVHAIE